MGLYHLLVRLVASVNLDEIHHFDDGVDIGGFQKSLPDFGPAGFHDEGGFRVLGFPVEALAFLFNIARFGKVHDLEPVEEPLKAPNKYGSGASLTEAPRGTLYHAYAVDSEGTVTSADIVTPTAHNVAAMEFDIDELVRILDPDPPEAEPDPRSGIRLEAERLLRAYDPCFSCATHFVTLTYRSS